MNMVKKTLQIFDRKQKNEIVKLTVLILLGGFSELVGVSVVVPFINAVIAPDELMQEPVIRRGCEILGITKASQLIVGIALFLCMIYILKNLVALLLANRQYKFTAYGQRDLKNRIMRCYLAQDYSFHQDNNSADLIRNITSDTQMFYETVLNMIQVASECCVSIVLVVYLLIKDPGITLGVSLSMGALVFLFLKKFKNLLSDLGNQRRDTTAAMMKCMQQGFGGIKEIKVSNKESVFCQDFEKSNHVNAEATQKNLFLNIVPKPIMEVICVCSLMLVIAFKVAFGSYTDDFIITLGVFGIAAFRLLPSVNRISSYMGTVIHQGVAVDAISRELVHIREMEQNIDIAQKSRKEAIPFDNKISLEDVSFQYPNTEDCVLEHVQLTISKNESVAFIGPSGAGKTTLVDLILGILKPVQGQIRIDGLDLEGKEQEWHEQIGYIPQTIYMLDDTIRNNVRFELSEDREDDERIWEALEEAQLKEFVKGLEHGLDTVIGEAGTRISGGQRQRLGIARALYRNPSLLILDEATSALDSDTEAAVMESIEHLRGRMTLLIIAHRLSTIENCDVVYEVKDKKVAEKQEEADG